MYRILTCSLVILLLAVAGCSKAKEEKARGETARKIMAAAPAPQKYVLTKSSGTITTQTGMKITVTENSFVTKSGSLVTGPVTVTVTQAGVVPTLSVTPLNQDVSVAAGMTNFSVSCNTNWTASSNAISWCTVTQSGTGNGTVVATYAENTALAPRQAIVTVSVPGITPVNVTVSQEGLVGISERIQGNILLFPNPTKGRFTIGSSDQRLLQMDVEVVTIDGKIVSATNCSGKSSYIFDLSSQPKGIYFVRIITMEGTSIRKIIVE